MKKMRLNNVLLDGSNMLSMVEKKNVLGGIKFPPSDNGGRCQCPDGSWVMPISFRPFLCPSDCPIGGYDPGHWHS